MFGDPGAIKQQVDLEIQGERADVEIARADERYRIIDAHGFGVQQALVVKIKRCADVQQIVVIRSPGRADEFLIDAPGTITSTLTPSKRPFAWLEERLRRARNTEWLWLRAAWPHEWPPPPSAGSFWWITRTAAQGLHGDFAAFLRIGKELIAVEGFVGFEIPVGYEYRLEFHDDRTGQPDHQVVPRQNPYARNRRRPRSASPCIPPGRRLPPPCGDS